MIYKVKNNLTIAEKARWEAMKQAKKILLQDGTVAPFLLATFID